MCRISFSWQLSLQSCTSLHWTIQFLSGCSVLLSESAPTWTSEAERLRRDQKPRKTRSQRLPQMADVSVWQATCDPPDQHGACTLSTHRNSLNPGEYACVLCPDLWLAFLERRWGTWSWTAGWLIKESRRGCLSWNYVYNVLNDSHEIFSR